LETETDTLTISFEHTKDILALADIETFANAEVKRAADKKISLLLCTINCLLEHPITSQQSDHVTCCLTCCLTTESRWLSILVSELRHVDYFKFNARTHIKKYKLHTASMGK
jgi:hypothetical protein